MSKYLKYMRDEPHAGNVGPVRTKEQPVQRPWGRSSPGRFGELRPGWLQALWSGGEWGWGHG